MAEDLRAELYEALRVGAPETFHSSGLVPSGKGWVLSSDTVRAVVALQGGAVPPDFDSWLSNDGTGQLLGLPYRVDDAVDRFALETIESAR